MSKPSMVSKSVRLHADTVHGILDVGRRLRRTDEEAVASSVDFSDMVRTSVERSVRQVKEAPYWATDAQHFVYVTAAGDFFYWFSETLDVKQPQARLSIRVKLKHDKMEDYMRDARKAGEELSGYLKSRWEFHAFRLSRRDGLNPGDWLHDEDGIGEKVVEVDTGLAGGHQVTRQGVTHLNGYVRWHRRVGDRDGAWLEIRVPTRRLRFGVIVDPELYQHTDVNQRPGTGVQPLERVLTNMEGEHEAFLKDAREIHQALRIGNVFPPSPGKSTDSNYQMAHNAIVGMARTARESAFDAAAGRTTPYAPPELPSAYYFSYLDIGPVWQGEHVGVTWPRPARPPTA